MSTQKEIIECYCNNIRRTSRIVTHFYEHIMHPTFLKATQYTLLYVLKEYGPMTINNLSDLTKLDRTTLVRNLKLIVSKGWAITEKDVSKAHIIQLSEKGYDIWNKAYPYWEQAQQRINEILTDDELKYLNSILLKLENSIDNSFEDV